MRAAKRRVCGEEYVMTEDMIRAAGAAFRDGLDRESRLLRSTGIRVPEVQGYDDENSPMQPVTVVELPNEERADRNAAEEGGADDEDGVVEEGDAGDEEGVVEEGDAVEAGDAVEEGNVVREPLANAPRAGASVVTNPLFQLFGRHTPHSKKPRRVIRAEEQESGDASEFDKRRIVYEDEADVARGNVVSPDSDQVVPVEENTTDGVAQGTADHAGSEREEIDDDMLEVAAEQEETGEGGEGVNCETHGQDEPQQGVRDEVERGRGAVDANEWSGELSAAPDVQDGPPSPPVKTINKNRRANMRAMQRKNPKKAAATKPPSQVQRQSVSKKRSTPKSKIAAEEEPETQTPHRNTRRSTELQRLQPREEPSPPQRKRLRADSSSEKDMDRKADVVVKKKKSQRKQQINAEKNMAPKADVIVKKKSPQKQPKKRKRLSEVLKLQKALETAVWTDSVKVQEQTQAIIVWEGDSIPNAKGEGGALRETKRTEGVKENIPRVNQGKKGQGQQRHRARGDSRNRNGVTGRKTEKKLQSKENQKSSGVADEDGSHKKGKSAMKGNATPKKTPSKSVKGHQSQKRKRGHEEIHVSDLADKTKATKGANRRRVVVEAATENTGTTNKSTKRPSSTSRRSQREACDESPVQSLETDPEGSSSDERPRKKKKTTMSQQEQRVAARGSKKLDRTKNRDHTHDARRSMKRVRHKGDETCETGKAIFQADQDGKVINICPKSPTGTLTDSGKRITEFTEKQPMSEKNVATRNNQKSSRTPSPPPRKGHQEGDASPEDLCELVAIETEIDAIARGWIVECKVFGKDPKTITCSDVANYLPSPFGLGDEMIGILSSDQKALESKCNRIDFDTNMKTGAEKYPSRWHHPTSFDPYETDSCTLSGEGICKQRLENLPL